MNKPSKYPEFASNTVNLQEPSNPKKESGWVFKEKPPYDMFNWIHKITNDWLQWIVQELEKIIEKTVTVTADVYTSQILQTVDIEIIKRGKVITFKIPTVSNLANDRTGLTFGYVIHDVSTLNIGDLIPNTTQIIGSVHLTNTTDNLTYIGVMKLTYEVGGPLDDCFTLVVLLENATVVDNTKAWSTISSTGVYSI